MAKAYVLNPSKVQQSVAGKIIKITGFSSKL